jgi:ATP-dependent Clp protease ATP-binding subunit ClpB
LKRVLQRLVLNELSKEIIKGTISKDSEVEMTVDPENNLRFINHELSVEA